MFIQNWVLCSFYLIHLMINFKMKIRPVQLYVENPHLWRKAYRIGSVFWEVMGSIKLRRAKDVKKVAM